jgi:hypothetical protein
MTIAVTGVLLTFLQLHYYQRAAGLVWNVMHGDIWLTSQCPYAENNLQEWDICGLIIRYRWIIEIAIVFVAGSLLPPIPNLEHYLRRLRFYLFRLWLAVSAIWLIGLGFIAWAWVAYPHNPPPPQLLWLVLLLIGAVPMAATVAVAWAIRTIGRRLKPRTAQN